MGKFEKRAAVRHKALIPAFASDLDETFQMRCLIRNVSENGCQLVASRVYEIPEEFHLTPQGFGLPLHGQVMWRDRKTVGVRLSRNDPQQDHESAGSQLLKNCQMDAADDVLVLGGEPHRPHSYLQRMKIYFSALQRDEPDKQE